MIKWMGCVFGSYSDITFPAVIVGLDMGLKDAVSGLSKMDAAKIEIDEKYNRPEDSKKGVAILPIATIEDVLLYGNFSEKKITALEGYIQKNRAYGEKPAERKVA
jgi:hypothetical protein